MSDNAAQLPTSDAFAEAFGEPIKQVLDLNTWCQGADLASLYPALRQMVAQSVEQERRVRNPIRAQVFPRIRQGINAAAPKSAGVYQMDEKQIELVHRGLLFNGGTECCDGTVVGHNSLVLSVYQIGMALVAYQGSCGTWVHRLYRHDMYAQFADPIEETLALLRKRQQREPDNAEAPRDPLTRLIRRALMDWAERAILTRVSKMLWRMGHGHPIPYSLLLPTTDALVEDSVAVLRELILEHKRFVFVSSEPSDRFLLTLGNALHPLEFAVVETLEHSLSDAMLHRLAAQGGHQQALQRIGACVREVRSEVVTGVYRASLHAPARVFYAHKDFACEAAAIAMADSVLQPHRGFPMLIDLADIVCGNTFDCGTFLGTIHDAYAAAGEPIRYLGERETRS
ncbi:MAG TPA: hypothetical protein VFB38_27010 [Chthonomonadaceae bacterium]|nr:hypothetical protein [Chthonomonadaceae bacterium]